MGRCLSPGSGGNTDAGVDDDFQPSGLCLLPGEKALLINDTGPKHIYSYAVSPTAI